MFAMSVGEAQDIESSWRRGDREPSFWRALVLMGLIAVAGLVLSALVGSPVPIE
jgi:hypothetical protein